MNNSLVKYGSRISDWVIPLNKRLTRRQFNELNELYGGRLCCISISTIGDPEEYVLITEIENEQADREV